MALCPERGEGGAPAGRSCDQAGAAERFSAHASFMGSVKSVPPNTTILWRTGSYIAVAPERAGGAGPVDAKGDHVGVPASDSIQASPPACEQSSPHGASPPKTIRPSPPGSHSATWRAR